MNCYYYDEQRNRCNCYVNENLDELLAENAKLRKMAEKYVRLAYVLAREKGNPITKDIIMEDAREIGIEVSE